MHALNGRSFLTPAALDSALAVVLVLAVLFNVGCRRTPDKTETLASSSARPTAALRCSAPGSATHTISGGKSSASRETGGLPFAVELGAAISLSGEQPGYALAALREVEDGTGAALFLLPLGIHPVRTIDLGRVHGNAAPPRLGQHQGDVIVVLSDSDAGGGALRLGRVTRSAGAVAWGAEVHEGDDESRAFDLAISAGSDAQGGSGMGLLAWDDWSESSGHGIIRVAAFSPGPLRELGQVLQVSAADVDAEAPRVVPRAGGFWVAWLSNAPLSRPEDPEPEGSERTLRPPKRWVEVQRLDHTGKPVGSVRRVGDADSRVVGYEIAGTDEDTVWLALRDRVPALGSDGGIIQLVRVAADGTTEELNVIDRDLGAGMPTLFASGAGAQRDVWLSYPGPAEAPLLTPVSLASDPTQARVEPALGRATPLARNGDQLLLATPRGRDLVLSSAQCHVGP